MTVRALATAALAAVGMLALVSCSAAAPGGSSSEDFAEDGTFTTMISQDPGDLNPLVTNLVSAQFVNAYAYDSLLFVEPSTGDPKPYLATSWEDGADRVSFTLRDDITCSDGTPFTAQVAADNFSWVADPANGSPLMGTTVPAGTVATAEGDVLTVTTPGPSPFLLKIIGSAALACPAALEDPKAASAASVGTGPFTITEVVPNDHITLERRDDYAWGPDGLTTAAAGVPKTVTVKIVTDPSTAANLLLAGELNAAPVTGADEERVIGASLDSRSYSAMSGEIMFNQYEGLPTADVAVRQALIQAADLDTYTTINTAEKGVRATSLLAPEPLMCTYDSVDGAVPGFDAKAAAKTLADAGWTKGAGGKLERDGSPLAISVVYINSIDAQSAGAEYLAGLWEELGVTVKLVGGDRNALLSNTFSAPDPSSWSVVLGLTIQTNTPSILPPYLSGATPPDGINFASVDNPEYTELATTAASLAGDESCATWEQAERALFESADIIPISITKSNMYFNGATTVIDPSGGLIPGAGIRVLK